MPGGDTLRRLADTDFVGHVIRIVMGADVSRVGRSRRLRPAGWRVSLSQDGAGNGGAARVQQLGAARSGRSAFVSMVEAADLRDRDDVAITAPHDWTGNRRVFIQRQVSPGLFVV